MADKKTPETIDEILARVTKGESIVKICGSGRDDFTPSTAAWYKWLDGDKDLVDRYARACEARAEYLFEQILDISDDGTNDMIGTEDGERLNSDHIQRSKLRVDSRKWMLARLQPKKYGDKIEQNHTSDDGSMTPTKIIRELVTPKETKETP
tara:strand:+ start:33 stop:488 length:456 start_codon:yes stop_codon:yes gene_type:complete